MNMESPAYEADGIERLSPTSFRITGVRRSPTSSPRRRITPTLVSKTPAVRDYEFGVELDDEQAAATLRSLRSPEMERWRYTPNDQLSLHAFATQMLSDYRARA